MRWLSGQHNQSGTNTNSLWELRAAKRPGVTDCHLWGHGWASGFLSFHSLEPAPGHGFLAWDTAWLAWDTAWLALGTWRSSSWRASEVIWGDPQPPLTLCGRPWKSHVTGENQVPTTGRAGSALLPAGESLWVQQKRAVRELLLDKAVKTWTRHWFYHTGWSPSSMRTSSRVTDQFLIVSPAVTGR